MKKSAVFVGFIVLIAMILTLPAWTARVRSEVGALSGGYQAGTLPAFGFYGMINPLWQLSSAVKVLFLQEQESDSGKLVLGGSYTLKTGDTLNGDLVILGGSANIQEAAFVNGETVVLGGALHLSGTISGDVLVLGGLAELGKTAHIQGDVTTISGNLNRDPGAMIDGDVNTSINGPLPLPLPTQADSSTWVNGIPGLAASTASSIWDGLFFFFRSFMWAALAVLLVLFLPKQTERTADTVVANPIITIGLGLLTTFVAPVLVVFIAITIIGIPLAIFMALILAIAWAFGLIAVGAETGKRLGRMLNQNWALPVSAAVGAFLLTIVINGIQQFIPCIGWAAPVLVGSAGLGAVVLTLFGSRDYPRQYPQEFPQGNPGDYTRELTGEKSDQ